MEATPLPLPSLDDWAERFGAALHTQRARVREFVGAQQARLQRAETQLSEQLQSLCDELSRETQQSQLTRREIEQRQAELSQEMESLERLRQQLAARQTEWERLNEQTSRQQAELAEQWQRQQAEWDRRQAALAEIERELDQRQTALAEQGRAAAAESAGRAAQQAEIEALRQRLEARQAELDSQQAQLAERIAQTEAQRRRLARELQERHTTQMREISRLRDQTDRHDSRELDDWRRRAAESEARAAELAGQIETLRGESRRQQSAADMAASGGENNSGLVLQLKSEAQRLQAERDAALAQLDEAQQRAATAEQRLTEALAAEPVGAEDQADYHRRYELAMDDLKEMKARNAEMQRELSRLRSADSPKAPAAPGGVLNWEMEKQRILAALESAGDDGDEKARHDRVNVQEIVSRTDRLLAEKDRLLAEKECEIEELKHLLQDQSGHLGAVAVGAAAFGEFLDQDAVVQEHREHLQRLQASLEEKLRQAEIDISLERAKLARDRAKLEEQLRAMEASPPPAPEDTGKGEKPTRGRWLARMGLKGNEET
jgi:chromosome segregation ATPase